MNIAKSVFSQSIMRFFQSIKILNLINLKVSWDSIRLEFI